MNGWRGRPRCALLLVTTSIFAAAMAAGSERPMARRDVVPERTIILLQQDINALTSGAPDATLYGTAKDADLLRQIAVATRASAQAQLELLRQQNEIIRLLELLQRGREAVR